MNLNWRKRLDKVAASVTPSTSGVMFIPLEGESHQDLEERVERWKAGERVEGIDQLYTGKESCVWIVKPVYPPKRDE